jgi:hypothetical protein
VLYFNHKKVEGVKNKKKEEKKRGKGGKRKENYK